MGQKGDMYEIPYPGRENNNGTYPGRENNNGTYPGRETGNQSVSVNWMNCGEVVFIVVMSTDTDEHCWFGFLCCGEVVVVISIIVVRTSDNSGNDALLLRTKL